MSNNDYLSKVARKTSNDPVQEKLRSSKDVWNKERVKPFIHSLIEVKKAINGRGSQSLGIAPSNIKDQLPEQIGSILNELASSFSTIVSDANHIIDAQKYYSEHRRKPQPKQPLAVTTDFQPELIANASWAGSRMWARVSLLKKIDRTNRRLRLEMLNSGAEISKALKGFEFDILNYKNEDSIADAIQKLSNICNLGFSSVFLSIYDKYHLLINNTAGIVPDKNVNKPSEKPAETIKPPIYVQTEQAKPDKKRSIKEEPKPIEQAKPSNNPSIIDRFKEVYDQLTSIEIVINTISNTDESLEKAAKLQSMRSDLMHDAFVFSDLINRSDHGKSQIELEKLGQDIIEIYNQLLVAAVETFGPAKDFDELAQKIGKKMKISEYLEIIENQERIKKIANKAISKWLNRNWLSINSSNIDMVRLNMAETSTKVRKELNSLMDYLEDRDADLEKISKKLSDTCVILSDLTEQAVSLSKNQILAGKVNKIDKVYSPIDRTHITYLREFKSRLNKYIGKNE
jgi:hypothetical protein